MISKKFVGLVAAAVVGATLMVVPAQARFGFGGMGGGGFAHMGGFGGGFGGMRGGFAHMGGFGGGFGGMRGGFAHFGGFGGFHRGFFPAHRFAFFPHRFAFFPRHRFITPFVGFGALAAAGALAAGSSCWTWVPTAYGWQRVWACSSDYGY
jgi:hypothetical protein